MARCHTGCRGRLATVSPASCVGVGVGVGVCNGNVWVFSLYVMYRCVFLWVWVRLIDWCRRKGLPFSWLVGVRDMSTHTQGKWQTGRQADSVCVSVSVSLSVNVLLTGIVHSPPCLPAGCCLLSLSVSPWRDRSVCPTACVCVRVCVCVSYLGSRRGSASQSLLLKSERTGCVYACVEWNVCRGGGCMVISCRVRWSGVYYVSVVCAPVSLSLSLCLPHAGRVGCGAVQPVGARRFLMGQLCVCECICACIACGCSCVAVQPGYVCVCVCV